MYNAVKIAVVIFLIVAISPGYEVTSETAIIGQQSPRNTENKEKILEFIESVNHRNYPLKINETTICIWLTEIYLEDKSCFEIDISVITQSLLNAYLDVVNSKNGTRISVSYLSNVSKQFDKFLLLDYYVFFHCFPLSQFTAMFEDEKAILNNVLTFSPNCRDCGTILVKIFHWICTNIETAYFIRSQNYALRSWYPYRNDKIGIALANNNISYIGMYDNPNRIDFTNLELAAYIPYDFLEDLTVNYTNEAKRSLRVLMLFAKKYKDLNNNFKVDRNAEGLVGVMMPGHCKYNNLPLLKMYSRSEEGKLGGWIAIGEDYRDSRFAYKCFLHQMSFVYSMYENEKRSFGESVKNEYCMPHTFLTNVGNVSVALGNRNPSTGATYTVPENYCLSDYFTRQLIHCNEDGEWEEPECVEHQTSNETVRLYGMYIDCILLIKCDRYRYVLQANYTSYVDVMFALYIASNINMTGDNQIFNLVDRGLHLAENLSHPHNQLLYVYSILRMSIIWHMLPIAWHTLDAFIVRSRFIYTYLIPRDGSVGLIVRKGKNNFFEVDNVEILNTRYSDDYASNDNIEVIVETLPKYKNITIDVFIIYNNKVFLEDDSHRCKSRIVYLQSSARSIVQVYFRTVDGSNEGYSVEIETWPRAQITYISQSRRDICDNKRSLTTMMYSHFDGKSVFNHIEIEKRDIVTHLTILMNPIAYDYYKHHGPILRHVKIIGASLSVLGIISSIISIIAFKQWNVKFYSLQLIIAATFQTVFFLINTDSLNHIGYLFFYYGMLSQIIWMLLTGYEQYSKFVKVFDANRPSKSKCLIIGWLIPSALVAISIVYYPECLYCDFCIRNREIFTFFVIIPVSILIICNSIIYIAVVISVFRIDSNSNPEENKLKKRLALIFPFLLGLSWIFLMALFVPSNLFTLIGWYLFYGFVPAEGFILFIFIVCLDNNMIAKWKDVFRSHVFVHLFTDKSKTEATSS